MKNIIDKSGMTLKKFAIKFEIPYNTVRQWYNGERNAPHWVKNLIEEVLSYKPLINEYKNVKIIKNITEKIEWAIVDNTYPDFDKSGKPINVWKAITGYEEIEKIIKKEFSLND